MASASTKLGIACLGIACLSLACQGNFGGTDFDEEQRENASAAEGGDQSDDADRGAGASGGDTGAGTNGGTIPQPGGEAAGDDRSDAGVGATPDAPTGDASGLPCEVTALLVAQCIACHGATPIAGANAPLVTRDDLRAPSPSAAGLNNGEDSLARMKSSGAAKMPPGPAAVDATQLEVFENWVAAGMPATTCGSEEPLPTPPESDGAFDGPSVCTSEQFRPLRSGENSRMTPGQPCIDCHRREGEGPRYTVAGTIYPTGHEPDDCVGVDGRAAGITVEITDAAGNTLNLTPNEAGNFFTSQRLTFPITTKIISPDGERPMLTPFEDGDCNTCHDENGSDGAPGRIVIPY